MNKVGTSGVNKKSIPSRPRTSAGSEESSEEEWLHEAPEEPQKATGRSNPRLIGEARYYCYTCGSPWPKDASACPACRGSDRSRGAARPRRAAENDIVLFDGPWKMIPWPKQGTVAMYGGPGAGKSSLAGLLQPRRWLTREQEPKPVGDMFRRILPDFMPAVESVDTPDDVRRVLSETTRGPVVLDSLTAFGLREALVVAHLLVKWAQNNNDRALAILQLNKDGQAAGYMEIPHLFDAIINVSPDPWGVRAFRVTKSRWCPLESVYWTFDREGKLTIPAFPASYSVEGAPGEYWLHPYPLKGAKWNGILGAMNGADILRPGVASAAIVAGYMPSGFLEPMDVLERKRFAEQNGLAWVSAEEASERIAETSAEGRVEKNNPFGDDPEEDE